jgi:uncharacterized protein
MEATERPRMTWLGRLAAVATGYVALCALIFVMQERMVFLPEVPGREIRATPAALGLDYQDLAITAADGVRLHAWWVPAPQARRTVLHFHGNAGNIGDRLEMLQVLRGLGVSVLLLEYRGYGRSEGRPAEDGFYLDAQAAWQHLTGALGVAPGSLVVHGQSMGGAVAAWLAARRPCGGLVLESAFTSIPDMAGELYPWLPGRWLTTLRLDTLGEVSRARCPVLVIHSTGDEIIPYSHGQRIHAAAPAPRQMVTIGGDHNSGFWVSRQAYTAGWRDFLASLPN